MGLERRWDNRGTRQTRRLLRWSKLAKCTFYRGILSCQAEPPDLSAKILLQCCSLSHNIEFPSINFFCKDIKSP